MSLYVRVIKNDDKTPIYAEDFDITKEKTKMMMDKKSTSLVTYEEQDVLGVEDLVLNYISDIHLDHKLLVHRRTNPSNFDIEQFLMKTIAKMGYDNSEDHHHFSLFAGDTSFNPRISATFYDILNSISANPWESISVLGNHELWEKCPNESLEEYVGQLKEHWAGTLLQNDVLFIKWNPESNWREPTTEVKLDVVPQKEIMEMSDGELRGLCESAISIIVGGTGFSGYEPKWNASSGIYLNAISEEEDLRQTRLFEGLYERMKAIASDLPVIVLTHMPKDNWSREPYVEGWTYVSGHTHRNLRQNMDGARVFSDNQIGYHDNHGEIKFKRFTIRPGYDRFGNLEDGIHEITRDDFLEFHHNRALHCTFTREGKIYLLKKEGMYMFIFNGKGKNLNVMRQGKLQALERDDIGYYFENMSAYRVAVDDFLEPYGEYQKKVASEVRALGGSGKMHGCIVDINYYNHIYVNPFDGSLTAYYAKNKAQKWVYPNVKSLLKKHVPELYRRMKDNEGTINDNSLILYKGEIGPAQKVTYVKDQEIYDYSMLVFEIQRVRYNGIIRSWDDRVTNLLAHKDYDSAPEESVMMIETAKDP